MTIAARPTVYRGIQMRSRLEARFAAWLDNAGDDWRYEPRAYADQRGQYLPDFEVTLNPGGSVFYEVKPTVAAAVRVFERMQIIHESAPAAALIVACPDESGHWLFWLSAFRGDRWALVS